VDLALHDWRALAPAELGGALGLEHAAADHAELDGESSRPGGNREKLVAEGFQRGYRHFNVKLGPIRAST
jgi:hypothetical protein